ncbi:MAG TPA: methyltransferase [Gaiellaceae bacterium]|nr:methyltransferase [Gaiellaceae bacterium]
MSASAAELLRLANGHQVARAIQVAAELGVADAIGDRARAVDELAPETDADEQSLYRLLRALAAVGVLREAEGRRFELTELGQPLRSDDPNSIAGWAAFAGIPSIWAAWGALDHSIKTGENAFKYVHGKDVWAYRAERPEESALFDGAMASHTSRASDAVLEAQDFDRFSVIVDVGGGNGTLLAKILARNPQARGILFDQPHVVAEASLPERCEAVGGSFFDGVPEAADAYVLKAIIHDWEDAEAVAILQSVRRAIAPDGRLFLIEWVLGGPNERPAAKFSDLNMLVNPGGRERTIDEYASLYEQAGFRLVGETETSAGHSVIEGAPA